MRTRRRNVSASGDVCSFWSLGARCSCDGELVVVARNFAWGEFFGAERKLDLKYKMKASVKEVQKLSADAKKVVGVSGGPSYGAAGERNKKSWTVGWQPLFPPRLR